MDDDIYSSQNDSLNDSEEWNDFVHGVGMEDSANDDESSWISESVGGDVECPSWKGWRTTLKDIDINIETKSPSVLSLTESCAKVVAQHKAFEELESHNPPVPEDTQLRIAFWSFPRSPEDISTYCCLANGSVLVLFQAAHIIRAKGIKDMLQIGFHLSGKVLEPSILPSHYYTSSVTFDRCNITSCQCPCNYTSQWCPHVVALCLVRIVSPNLMTLHPPVSDSLSRLKRDQLQKFVQHLISELPQQILPTAQHLLDELLLKTDSEINQAPGAPDPTAGGSLSDDYSWFMHPSAVRENIRKLLGRLTGPSPIAFVDITSFFSLSYTPPTVLGWSNILKPLQSRDPEGISNLLLIVRDLFTANDSNGLILLEILTEEIFLCHRILIAWFSVSIDQEKSISFNLNESGQASRNITSRDSIKYASTYMLNGVAETWKWTVLQPNFTLKKRNELRGKLVKWHDKAIEIGRTGIKLTEHEFLQRKEHFVGFQRAIDACDDSVYETFKAVRECKDLSDILMYGEHCYKPEHYENHEDGILRKTEFGCSFIKSNGEVKLSWDLTFLITEARLFHGDEDEGYAFAKQVGIRLLTQMQDMNKEDLNEENQIFIKQLTNRIHQLSNILMKKYDQKALHLVYGLIMANFSFGCTIPSIGHVDQIQQIHKEFQLYDSAKDLLELCEISHIPLIAEEIMELALSYDHQREEDCYFMPYMFGILCFEILCRVDLQIRTLVPYKKGSTPGVDRLGPETKDEYCELGFKLACVLLGELYPTVFANDAMYCEMIRRLMHDLALCLLTHYQNKAKQVKMIMDALLDANKFGIKLNSDGTFETENTKHHGAKYEIVCYDDEMFMVTNPGYSEYRHQITSNSLPPQYPRTSAMEHSGSSLPTYFDRGNYPVVDSAEEDDWDTPDVIANEDEEKTEVVPPNDAIIVMNEEQPGTSLGVPIPINNVTLTDCKKKEEGTTEQDHLESPTKTQTENPQQELRNKPAKKRIRDRSTIEAESFSLFELGKDVLNKINVRITHYGLSGDAENRPAPSRLLHLCAFEIVLFSLRLYNEVTRNWMSRTYSMHGSWIETQARDLGTPAIKILINKWQGALTPSEIIIIAEKVTRSSGVEARQVSAELILSCLPQAHTLNLGSLQVAVTLCREQGIDVLEQACLSIEDAASNGGLDPSLLFLVARQWDHIHLNTNVKSKKGKYISKTPLITPEQFVEQQMHRKAEEYIDTTGLINKFANFNVGGSGSKNGSFVGLHPCQGDGFHRCALPEHLVQARVFPNSDNGLNTTVNKTTSDPRYFRNAFRLGMKAMEVLSLRHRDQPLRSNSMLALPCDSDDISWLCTISASLGISYLKQFCNLVLNAVSNPLLLHDLALDAGQHFALFNPAQLASNLRSASVAPLVQKCLNMYSTLIMREIITLRDVDRSDFIELLRRARSAFCMTPGGMSKFNDMLQRVRRQTSSDLWQLILNGLSRA